MSKIEIFVKNRIFVKIKKNTEFAQDLNIQTYFEASWLSPLTGKILINLRKLNICYQNILFFALHPIK